MLFRLHMRAHAFRLCLASRVWVRQPVCLKDGQAALWTSDVLRVAAGQTVCLKDGQAAPVLSCYSYSTNIPSLDAVPTLWRFRNASFDLRSLLGTRLT